MVTHKETRFHAAIMLCLLPLIWGGPRREFQRMSFALVLGFMRGPFGS